MKRSIFKLLAVVGRVSENDKKSLRREAPVVKHRLAGLFGFAMTTFFLVNHPGVTWSQEFPQEIFGPVIGNPSCSSLPPNQVFIMCGVKNSNRHLLGISFNPGISGSEADSDVGGPVAGVIVGDPSCAAAATSLLGAFQEMICAVIGTDLGLWGIRFSTVDIVGTARTPFRPLSGPTGPRVDGNPSCVRVGENLICGVRGRDSALWVIRFNPVTNASSGLRSLGGPVGGMIVGDPSCAENGTTTSVTCAVMGTDGSLYGIRFASSAFNDPNNFTFGFQNLGTPPPVVDQVEEVISPNPSGRTWDCASSMPKMMMQEVTCAVMTVSNHLFGIRFDPPHVGLPQGSNSGFQNLGVPPDRSPLVGKPSCTRVPRDFMNCIVKGAKNRVFGVIFDPSRRDIKAQLTDILFANLGAIVSDPSCATTQLPRGRFGICAVIDGDNNLQAIVGVEE